MNVTWLLWLTVARVKVLNEPIKRQSVSDEPTLWSESSSHVHTVLKKYSGKDYESDEAKCVWSLRCVMLRHCHKETKSKTEAPSCVCVPLATHTLFTCVRTDRKQKPCLRWAHSHCTRDDGSWSVPVYFCAAVVRSVGNRGLRVAKGSYN